MRLKSRVPNFLKYVVNGLFATVIHYVALTSFLNILHIQSAGLANLMAAAIGISFSFLGNRYFVFENHEKSIAAQAFKFSVLYGFIAIVHGVVMWVWSDLFNQDYRFGFLIATYFQFLLSYFGNKKMVFNR